MFPFTIFTLFVLHLQLLLPKSSSLFIDGERILSEEGTTQGDPLAMAMYALSTVPLINRLEGLAAQMWFADDAAAGSLVVLILLIFFTS